MIRLLCWVGFALSSATALAATGGNRLTYLDSPVDPYYVTQETARLITPQWVGEAGVDAVIVLAIDDMSDAEKYEQFLRPILDRLKRIDGRAPVSIMTQSIDPALPRLQSWAEEGVSIESHTQSHPCPCLQSGSFEKAKATFDNCVDRLSQLPSGGPVAFRMPCCDSMNSVSPRFFAEIFNKTTPEGRFLAIDTSVFMLLSPSDPALPRELVVDDGGGEKFRKYIPTDRTMANFIENYPYPYVIGRLCWEIPCLMPSDWDAQHLQGKCNPRSVGDFKAAIDATVVKQGIFALCFHPHGWIRNDQIVELIEYADKQYGKRVKFLNFREVLQRLNANLLGGYPLRSSTGRDNGVRVLDADADGLMDVVIARPEHRETRLWRGVERGWQTTEFPIALVNDDSRPSSEETGVRFGVLQPNGHASIVVRSEQVAGVWHFDGDNWQVEADGLRGLELEGPIATLSEGRDTGVRLRDLDGDGICEWLVGNERQNGVFAFSAQGWHRLAYSLPPGVTIVDSLGRDAGLRFVDFSEDGHADIVFSNAQRYSAHIFTSPQDGWSRTTRAGERGAVGGLPMIVRGDGTNNGAWFNHRHMWVQNEDTGGSLPDHVARRSFEHDLRSAN